LERNLRLDGCEEQIEAHHMGFYSESGDLQFFVPAVNEAASLRLVTNRYYFKEGEPKSIWTRGGCSLASNRMQTIFAS